MTETDLEIRRQFTAPPEKVWRWALTAVCIVGVLGAAWLRQRRAAGAAVTSGAGDD